MKTRREWKGIEGLRNGQIRVEKVEWARRYLIRGHAESRTQSSKEMRIKHIRLHQRQDRTPRWSTLANATECVLLGQMELI